MKVSRAKFGTGQNVPPTLTSKLGLANNLKFLGGEGVTEGYQYQYQKNGCWVDYKKLGNNHLLCVRIKFQ